MALVAERRACVQFTAYGKTGLLRSWQLPLLICLFLNSWQWKPLFWLEKHGEGNVSRRSVFSVGHRVQGKFYLWRYLFVLKGYGARVVRLHARLPLTNMAWVRIPQVTPWCEFIVGSRPCYKRSLGISVFFISSRTSSFKVQFDQEW